MLKINNIKVGQESFPNKEKVVRSLVDNEVFEFLLEYESDDDLFVMMSYARLYQDKTKTLKIPYFPYERADRLVDNKLPMVFAVIDMINFCGFKRVEILDPHNKSVFSELNNVVFKFPIDDWNAIIKKHNIDTICFPDNGAFIRYSDAILELKDGLSFITAKKVRDEVSGRIKSLELTSEPKPKSNILILDDLCSRGGTFVLTAEKLRNFNVGKIYLFTSHCERSVYEGDLIKKGSPIDKFYTKAPFLHGNDILNLI